MKQILTCIVVLCAALAAAQQNIDAQPGDNQPEVVQVSRGIEQAKADVEQAKKSGDNAAYQVAITRYNKLTIELASLRASIRQQGQAIKKVDGKVKKLDSRVSSLETTVNGGKDKQGKHIDGLVEWKNKLIAENGDLWWVAAKRGDIDKALEIAPATQAFFDAAKEAGYTTADKNGNEQFNASKFVSDFQGYGKRLDTLEKGDWKTWTALVASLLALIGVLWVILRPHLIAKPAPATKASAPQPEPELDQPEIVRLPWNDSVVGQEWEQFRASAEAESQTILNAIGDDTQTGVLRPFDDWLTARYDNVPRLGNIRQLLQAHLESQPAP
ncbi:MAG TPA: hypothetical protein VMQ44_02625 [Candidatus Saccharimonadales bacterium]|nr:hypothetical protein [Candidatus Saccharimonadales bacterium]